MSLQLMLVDARYEQQSIFLYAVDERGDHYTVQVDDFYPYFYVEPPSPAYDGHEIRRNLERLLDEKMPRSIQRPFIRDVEPIRKHKLLGYNFTKEPTDMYRFTMNSPAAIQKARKFLEHGLATNRTPCDTHEANVAFVMRFLVDHHLSGCGWFTVPIRPPELHHLHVSHVDVRSAAHLRDNIAPMTWLSFDIEASRVHNGGRGFVEAQYDPVTQIGCTLFNPARDLQRVVFCYCYEKDHGVSHLPAQGQANEIEKRIYYSEAEMLLAFRSYIVQYQVDVITGYNINGFDLPYLFDRAKTLGIADQFTQFSRTGADRPAYLKKTTFTSKAFGTRESFQLYCDGRFTFDMYQYVARQKKFRSYQLGSVAMQILKEPKVEMDYKLIPQFQAGTDEQRAHLAYYCWKDADLVAQLIRKLMVIPNSVEQCRVTGVPMAFLLSRGEQIKTFSKLLSLCATRNMVIPSSTESENDEDTQGALVFEPKRGLYKGKVIVLDFKSLYPSIMIWRNIGYSSLAPRAVLEAVPGWVEGVDYYIPPIPGCTWGFVSEKHYRCVLAEMEEDLLAARGKAKRDLKAETDPDRAQVLDGRQLALKLLCNSLYGFVKANMISEKRIMESVCAWGRELAAQTKSLVEAHFCKQEGYPMDTDVVYGDSVTWDTPILIRRGANTDQIEIVQIQDLVSEPDRWKTRDTQGKEHVQLDDDEMIEVWTEQGWTRISHIIRHRLADTKKIKRIVTHVATVDVTDEHSLLLKAGAETITPEECVVGKTELLHSFPPSNAGEETISPDEARVWGLFFADGSCGAYKGPKYSWAINKKDITLLQEAQKWLESCKSRFPGTTFKILDTLKSSSVYKLVPSGNIKAVVEFYRPLFYSSNKLKVVPKVILNSSLEVRKAFWEGYYRGDGDKDPNGYTRCDCKGKIGAMGLYYIMKSIGLNVSINTRADKPLVFRLTGTKAKQRKPPHVIKRIADVTSTYAGTYVYDLTTQNHHFQAGVGSMIVHNTDSVMVNFGEDITMEQAEEYAREAARLCTTHFGGAIELEFEKIYSPYLLQGKKRYAGYRYEGGNPPYVSSSGMETVRRDNAPIAPKTMNVMLDKILVQNDVPGAIAYAQTVVKELRTGKVPISDLIVTQSLSKSFKRYREKDTKLAHVELAERIRKRAHVTGEMPYATGDRVKYILAKRDKKAKKFEQVEDPMYALENGVPLDYDAYVEKQLMKPICRIMTPIVGKKQRYKRLRPQDEEDIELPAEDTVRYNAKGEKKQLTPREWKKLTAYKLIFEGEHMRTKKVRTSSTAGKAGSGGGVKHFFTVQRRCQVCKTLLPSGTARGQSRREESLYCGRCSASSAHESDQAAKQAQLATLQERQALIWRGCIVDCAKGNEELARACDNRDCPQLYARKQIVMDIEELDKLTH